MRINKADCPAKQYEYRTTFGNLCGKGRFLNLSTKAENLLAETKTDNGADANTAKHDICSNQTKWNLLPAHIIPMTCL